MDNSDDVIELLEVEAPISLLPDLSMWGIDSLEPGICLDTAENRRLLRENQARWLPVYDSHGRPTPLIQAVTEAMKNARLQTNKRVLLKDPKDKNSDYITGFSLIIEPKADDMAPAWVLACTRQFEDVLAERERRGAEGKIYRPALASYPHRCKATTIDGTRCQRWCNGYAASGGMCRQHLVFRRYDEGGNSHNIETITRVRNKMISAAEMAADQLEELAYSATSEPVRMQASREILDRAGIRGGYEIDQKVEVSLVDPAAIVRERLEKIAASMRPAIELQTVTEEPAVELEAVVIEAEVVDDAD